MTNKPWLQTYCRAKQRCNNSNNGRYKYYGGKGIRLLMTKNDFKFLWFRDLAFLLECPSIDRINSNGHYELSNCRFIERKLNALLASKNRPRKTHCINGHKFTIENTYINKRNIKCCRKCSRDSWKKHIKLYGRKYYKKKPKL